MAPDLNLTPQFGPLLGSRSNQHDPRTTSNMPDVDVSFLNSPLPNGDAIGTRALTLCTSIHA